MKLTVYKKSAAVGKCAAFGFFAVMFAALAVLAHLNGDSLFSELFMILMAVYCVIMIIRNYKRGAGAKCFKIDDNGVSYYDSDNEYVIEWENVKAIMLMPDKNGRYSSRSFINFVTREDAALYFSNVAGFSNEVVGVQYRKGIVEIIRKYTEMPIRSIELIER